MANPCYERNLNLYNVLRIKSYWTPHATNLIGFMPHATKYTIFNTTCYEPDRITNTCYDLNLIHELTITKRTTLLFRHVTAQGESDNPIEHQLLSRNRQLCTGAVFRTMRSKSLPKRARVLSDHFWECFIKHLLITRIRFLASFWRESAGPSLGCATRLRGCAASPKSWV